MSERQKRKWQIKHRADDENKILDISSSPSGSFFSIFTIVEPSKHTSIKGMSAIEPRIVTSLKLAYEIPFLPNAPAYILAPLLPSKLAPSKHADRNAPSKNG